MNGLAGGGHGRFFHRLAQCGMGMYSACQILGTATIFHVSHRRGDKFRSTLGNNLYSKQFIRFFASNDLYKAVSRITGNRTSIG